MLLARSTAVWMRTLARCSPQVVRNRGDCRRDLARAAPLPDTPHATSPRRYEVDAILRFLGRGSAASSLMSRSGPGRRGVKA